MQTVIYFNLFLISLFGLLLIGIIAYLRIKKNRSITYLLFFSIFYIYLFKVLDYTIFQIQSLLIVKYFIPNLMLSGIKDGSYLNLIPLITLTFEDINTSLLNILLFIPFGFGLPFVTDLRMKKVVSIGASLSFCIEFLQLIIGLLAKISFRYSDINDVIFNILGVIFGYILFIGFVRLFRHLSYKWKIPSNPTFKYIAERPQVD